MGRFSGKSEQEIWDAQMADNSTATWREAHQINAKMAKCKNNPRNNGRGNDPYQVDDEDPARQDTPMRSRWF